MDSWPTMSVWSIRFVQSRMVNPMLPDFFLTKFYSFNSESLKQLFSVKPSQFWFHLIEKNMFHKFLTVMNLKRSHCCLHSNQNFDFKVLNLHFKNLILSVNMETTLWYSKNCFKWMAQKRALQRYLDCTNPSFHSNLMINFTI